MSAMLPTNELIVDLIFSFQHRSKKGGFSAEPLIKSLLQDILQKHIGAGSIDYYRLKKNTVQIIARCPCLRPKLAIVPLDDLAMLLHYDFMKACCQSIDIALVELCYVTYTRCEGR
jgi:hypothetical protein